MKKFMIAALAAGMLTACSDSAVVETPAGGGAQWGADGTGYVSLSINLPKTTSAGRANGNDQFNDGNANEWAVNDAILMLFVQTTENEGDAEFKAAYQLPVNFKQEGSTDQITATAQITKRIQAISGGTIKALVILNGISSGVFKCDNTIAVDDKDHATLSYTGDPGSGSYTEVATNTKFSTFQTYLSQIPTSVAKGFLMMNAPLTDAQSNTGSVTFTGKKVSTLSEIIANNIKYTAAEAAAAPAANIYVERAVAKVTMSTTNINGTVPGGTSSPRTLNYKILGIALDNTNPTSYLVRNADLIDPNMMALRSASTAVQNLPTGYRMIGNETVGNDKPATGGKALYRTYFAKDVNYDTEATLTTSNTINDYNAKWVAPADVANSPLYCLENTFDVARMDFHNTTRAILKVQIGDGSDHYIMHNWDNAGDTWCNETEMKEKVRANIQAMAVYQGQTISEVEMEAKAGIQNVLVLKSYKVGETVTNSGDNFNTAKNRIGDVYKYVNGIAYYEVRIQHFGDDLTPWNKDEFTKAPKEGGIDDIYPTDVNQDGNYLGRYGVLRNNWYNLTVNSVKRIGTPYIPAVTGVTTPDDVINSYISVNINILSWAKREQGVDLQ